MFSADFEIIRACARVVFFALDLLLFPFMTLYETVYRVLRARQFTQKHNTALFRSFVASTIIAVA